MVCLLKVNISNLTNFVSLKYQFGIIIIYYILFYIYEMYLTKPKNFF